MTPSLLFGTKSWNLPLPFLKPQKLQEFLYPERKLPFRLRFQCNICGSITSSRGQNLLRETASCGECGSTLRMRGIVHGLSKALFGRSMALPDFPVNKEIKGFGMSDWDEYARRLSEKLDYVNTYYHQEPKLDITNIPSEMAGTCDFLISTDVFEHVAPPVDRAFTNAFKLLKENGVFVFSVPYNLEGETQEHFPNLFDYKISEVDGRWVLDNQTVDGKTEHFENLVFHGGPGETLEMRVFSLPSLRSQFRRAGFQRVEVLADPVLEYGLYWHQKWSLPMLAFK